MAENEKQTNDNEIIEGLKQLDEKSLISFFSANKNNYLEYTMEGIHLFKKGYKIISDKLLSNIVIE